MSRTLLRTAHKRRMAVKRDRKRDFTPGTAETKAEPSGFKMFYKPGRKIVSGKRISYESSGYLTLNIRKRPTEHQRAQIIELYEKGQRDEAEKLAAKAA